MITHQRPVPTARAGLELHGSAGERYRVLDTLGAGHGGAVYRAVGLDSGRVVAVKFLQLSERTSAERATLLRDLRAAATVVHPNVLPILHVASTEETYIIMPFVVGGSLAAFLRAQTEPIALSTAIAMMTDIARGAQAINTRLVHRDIKPDNILLDHDRLQLADLGSAAMLSVRHAPPECWAGRTVTAKADVYAVGLVCYEILTLRHPLATLVRDPWNIQDWYRAHLAGCPDVRALRGDVTPRDAQLLSRMVAQRPTDRPGWGTVLARLAER